MKPSPLAAWTLCRLLTGHPVNGELRTLPERFQPIGNRLAGLPKEGRQDAWEAFLDGQGDKEGIILALAESDPEEPAPTATGEDAEGEDEWGPIRLGTLPPAEPFPIETLPEPMARLVTDGARAIGCPPDFLAVPSLAVAGGVIGRSLSLRLKDGYFASSCVFAAFVGPPSDGKSPGCVVAAEAVKQIDHLLEDAYGEALSRWEEESSRPGPDGKKRSKSPPPPRPTRIDVDDITMEALPLILADNPRGLIMIRDELSALYLGMNQFKGGKGNDRQTILKIWSGGAIKKDRVNHEANVPIRCPHPCLSIMGGIPPDLLISMVDPAGRADGFLDRWLFAYPETLPVPDWSWRGVPEESSADWFGLVTRLWARPLNHRDGRSVPHVAFLTPEAEAAWAHHYNLHTAEMNASDFPPTMRGPWGKMREYAGRLALILACVHHASDPTADPAAVPSVGPGRVRDAWRLVDYFKAHARRVHATISLGPGAGGNALKAILSWARQGMRESFSEHEIKQARRWIKDDELAEALGALARQNAIRQAPRDAPNPKGGRRPSAVYLVNPALLDTQNPRNA